jgi:outer membrane protein assembly factor BamB
MQFSRSVGLALVVLSGALAPAAAQGRAEQWPGWRGPTGQGHTPARDLPLTWGGNDGENVLWRAPLLPDPEKARPDHNQSSPIVWGDRVFVTVSYWPATGPPKEFPEHHLLCFRAGDGKPLWDCRVPPGPWLLTDLRGGYTAPTPATDGERVYVAFGSSVLAAVDFTGKLLWRQEIKPYDFDVAMAASPVLYGDTALLVCDQAKKASSRLLAFDLRTGAVRWEQKRPTAGFSHSTPVVVEVRGKPHFLVAADKAVQGLDPATGKVLWWCAGAGDTSSPVYACGLVYCDGGRGGPGVAVDPGGEGDVTGTHRKWRVDLVPEGFSSPVAVGDYLYRLHNPGILKCWKLATGEPAYAERLPGVSTAASPVATADGRLYLASAGKSYVVQAGPVCKVLATNDLGDASAASAAVSGGRIFLKGARYLYCIGKKADR